MIFGCAGSTRSFHCTIRKKDMFNFYTRRINIKINEAKS